MTINKVKALFKESEETGRAIQINKRPDLEGGHWVDIEDECSFHLPRNCYRIAPPKTQKPREWWIHRDTGTRIDEADEMTRPEIRRKTGWILVREVIDGELEQLRDWKASAELVLNEWSAMWVWAGKPGKLGHSQASGVRGEIERLRGEAAMLLQALERVTASAHPNPTEHPQMWAAWQSAGLAIARAKNITEGRE